MRKIALIGCSARKKGRGTDNQYYAKCIYTGRNYCFSRDILMQQYNCENEFYILSGQHHLLHMNDQIRWYDYYLGNKSERKKKEWAQDTFARLNSTFDGNLDDIKFYIFAGNSYTRYLKEMLPHYALFRFNHRQITGDIIEER